MGRTKAPIDWDRVEKMAMAGANGVQIAAALGIHYNTLDKRSKEELKCDFSEYLTTKREKGNELLLRKQYDIAMSGDKTMLVWLGKQRLGQTDKSNFDHTTKGERITPVIEVNNDRTKANLEKLMND